MDEKHRVRLRSVMIWMKGDVVSKKSVPGGLLIVKEESQVAKSDVGGKKCMKT